MRKAIINTWPWVTSCKFDISEALCVNISVNNIMGDCQRNACCSGERTIVRTYSSNVAVVSSVYIFGEVENSCADTVGDSLGVLESNHASPILKTQVEPWNPP
jgi:hypothetical protein